MIRRDSYIENTKSTPIRYPTKAVKVAGDTYGGKVWQTDEWDSLNDYYIYKLYIPSHNPSKFDKDHKLLLYKTHEGNDNKSYYGTGCIVDTSQALACTPFRYADNDYQEFVYIILDKEGHQVVLQPSDLDDDMIYPSKELIGSQNVIDMDENKGLELRIVYPMEDYDGHEYSYDEIYIGLVYGNMNPLKLDGMLGDAYYGEPVWEPDPKIKTTTEIFQEMYGVTPSDIQYEIMVRDDDNIYTINSVFMDSLAAAYQMYNNLDTEWEYVIDTDVLGYIYLYNLRKSNISKDEIVTTTSKEEVDLVETEYQYPDDGIVSVDHENDTFTSFDQYSDNYYIQAQLTVYVDDEIFTIIKSQPLVVTPDIFLKIINNLSYTNIYNMNFNTPRLINRTVQQVYEMTARTDSKSNIIQPVFFRTQPTGTITIHPSVIENICINLDAYKSQVDTFVLKINNSSFQETGRTNNGIIFCVDGSVLGSMKSSGIYYILNEDGVLVTTGEYTAE